MLPLQMAKLQIKNWGDTYSGSLPEGLWNKQMWKILWTLGSLSQCSLKKLIRYSEFWVSRFRKVYHQILPVLSSLSGKLQLKI